MSFEPDSAVAPAVETPIAPLPAPETAPTPAVGPLVDSPEIRDHTRPDRIDPHPVIDLDKPLDQQLRDHEKSIAQQEIIDQSPHSLSSVAMPRTWSQDKAELWSKLDRPTQEYVLERARQESEATRLAQNRAAEAEQRADATVAPERERATQVASAYEAAFAALLFEHNGEFAQVRQALAQMTPEQRQQFLNSPQAAELNRRFEGRAAVLNQQGQALRQVFGEYQRSEEARQQQEFQQFGEQQDELFRQAVPDLAADPEKWSSFQEQTLSYLTDTIGIPEADVEALWTGTSKLTGAQVTRSHEFQRILADAVRYRDMLARAAAARPKIVPKPLAPGGGVQSTGPRDTPAAAAARGDMRAYNFLRNQGMGT